MRKHLSSQSHRKMVGMKGLNGENVFVNSFLQHRKVASLEGNLDSFGMDTSEKGREELKISHEHPRVPEADFPSIMTQQLEFASAEVHDDPFGWLFGTDTALVPDTLDLFPDAQLLDLAPSDGERINTQADFLDSISYKRIALLIDDILGKPQTDERRLTLSVLDQSLRLFWTSFNPTYPVIHQPSFQFDDDHDHNILVLCMICLGSTFAGEVRSDVSNEILGGDLVDGLFARLFVEIQRYRDVELIPCCLLQAIVLLDFLVSFQGAEYQQRKARFLHPLVINLVKERRLFHSSIEPLMDSDSPSIENWRSWVKFESMKRIAFLEYLIDSRQNHLHFRTPGVSIFEIQLELPYSDAVWCSSFEDFQVNYCKQPRDQRKRHQISSNEDKDQAVFDNEMNGEILLPEVRVEGTWPNFLWSLRRLTQPFRTYHKEYYLDCFSQFSRFILLHGLLSLVKEVRPINMIETSITSVSRHTTLASKIELAFFSWKVYFQNQIKEANAAISGQSQSSLMNNYGATFPFWSNLTLFGFGLLSLYSDLPLIVRFCENQHRLYASNLTGDSTFDRVEFGRNRLKLKIWAETKAGTSANQKACDILRTVFSNDQEMVSISHAPTAIYISALVCLVYQYENCRRFQIPKSRDYDLLNCEVHKKLTMDYLLSYEDSDRSLSKITSGVDNVMTAKALLLYSAHFLEKNFRIARVMNQVKILRGLADTTF